MSSKSDCECLVNSLFFLLLERTVTAVLQGLHRHQPAAPSSMTSMPLPLFPHFIVREVLKCYLFQLVWRETVRPPSASALWSSLTCGSSRFYSRSSVEAITDTRGCLSASALPSWVSLSPPPLLAPQRPASVTHALAQSFHLERGPISRTECHLQLTMHTLCASS